MANSIARATIVGNLTRDPELNASGKVLTLGIAVNRSQKTAEGAWEDVVSFLDVKVLGNRAQALAGFLAKGRQVAVDARIVQERWDDKETGAKRSAVRFIADEVMALGSRDQTTTGASDFGSDLGDTRPTGTDEDIPF